MRSLAALLCLAALPAALLAAPKLEPVTYGTAAALQAVWKPVGAEPAPPALRKAEGLRAARFEAPFTRLKDWRFSWDRDGHWDLSKAERVVLKLRASRAAALQGLLYLRSGNGWYGLPVFGVGPRWSEVELDLSQAKPEGEPSGWGSIDGLRLSLLPGAGGDAWLELRGIEAQGPRNDAWVWRVGGASGKEQCFGRILSDLRGQAYTDARHRLTQADGVLTKMHRQGLRGAARRQALLEARAKVAEAYALSQRPLGPALRGVWVHNGDGPRARGGQRAVRWKEALPEMAAAGINAVFPNVLWSGVAFYPSKIVPVHEGVAREGDYLREICDAAKPLGIQVHAWKVLWQFAEGWLAPAGVSQPFREQGRLQKDSHGKELAWLCPCDERNRRYELDALLELAAYPVDGVHLDYIRFEGAEAGFGDACKQRFEQWAGKTVEHWPADCAPGGPLAEAYADFKRETISSFVQQASKELRAARPGLQISAAVFPYPEQARRAVSQDWPRWLKEGWVDFVCPMTYTEDAASFAGATASQAALVGADKLRPGIQVSYDGGRVLALESLVDQLKAAAKAGAPGTVFFEWREQLQDTVLPYLRNGLWRDGAYDLRLREVPEAQRPPVVKPGLALEPPLPRSRGGKRPKPKPLRLDDFEDGDLVNRLRAPWSAQADANNLGTRLDQQPLQPTAGGAGGSAHALGLRGHFGANRAPWPYALLATGFNADQAPVDLRPYRALRFKARGDGKALELLLRRQVVKDYGDPRASVTLTPDWSQQELALDRFVQPGWAQPVPGGLADVTQLVFQPGGRDDEDFWFEIDDVELIR